MKILYVSTMGVLQCGGLLGDACFGNLQDSRDQGAILPGRFPVLPDLTPRKISFPSNEIADASLYCLQCPWLWHYHNGLVWVVADGRVR